MKKLNLIRILIIFTVINLFIYSLYRRIKYATLFEINSKLILKENVFKPADLKCNPYRTSPLELDDKAIIDQVEYPILRRLYQNNSIDFDCLNRNKFIKKS